MKFSTYTRFILSSVFIFVFSLEASFAFTATCKHHLTKVPKGVRKIRNKWAEVTMPKEFKNFDYEKFNKELEEFSKKSVDELIEGEIKLSKKSVEQQLAYIRSVSHRVYGENYKLLKSIETMSPYEMKKMAKSYLGMKWWKFGARNNNEVVLKQWIRQQLSLEYFTPHSWKTAIRKGKEERIDDLLEYIFQLQVLHEGILPTLKASRVFKKNNVMGKVANFYTNKKVKLATIFLLNQNLLFKTPRAYFLKIELIDLTKKEIAMIFQKPSKESFEIIKTKYKRLLGINVTYNRYRKFLNSLVFFYMGYSVYQVYKEEELSADEELDNIRSGKTQVTDGVLIEETPDDLLGEEEGKAALKRWVEEKYPDGASETTLLEDPEYLEKRYLFLGIDYDE